MNRLTILVCLTLLFAVPAGCGYQGRRVPMDVEAVLSQDFNPTDLHLMKDAVTELLAKDVFPPGRKPFVYVARVRNLTDEHINTEAISEYVAVNVGDSGQVRLTEVAKGLDEAIKQLEFQQGAFVDPASAKKAGKMIGADYFLQGELTNITTKAGRKRGQFFQFTLTLVNIETLESWKSLVHIQKVGKRGLFGW